MNYYLGNSRTCSACGGTCHWHDTAWVCGRCGSEWDADHSPQYAIPPVELADQVSAVYRTARKPWTCHLDPQHEIAPGDVYVEYLGESSAYQSGSRYCLACGTETWAAEKWSMS